MSDSTFCGGKRCHNLLSHWLWQVFMFFILPYLFDNINSRDEPWSVVIVVSPLQALMHYQVMSLRSKGVGAVIAGNENREL